MYHSCQADILCPRSCSFQQYYPYDWQHLWSHSLTSS